MEPIAERARRWRSLIGRSRLERGLDDELRFHLDQQTEKYIRAGLEPAEARRRAHVRFGGVEAVKEQIRDEFRPTLLEDAARDLRYGARGLRRAPGFALVAVLTLGLGTGAATAVFSVIKGVLLNPLPYPSSDRIVRLFQLDGTGARNGNVSEPNFEDWKAGTRAFIAMAQTSAGSVPVVVGDEASLVPGAAVSREFFDVMGVGPAVGRAFVAEEQIVGGRRAVLLADRFWRTRLNAAPLTGLALRIDNHVYDVIGVMPPEFDYPVGSQYWVARELTPPNPSRTSHNWQVVARLRDGVALDAARIEVSSVSRSLKVTHGDRTWMSDATAVPLREQLTASARPALLMLFGAALMLLAIACLNVSNLQLARASTRRREMAVRLALGAGRGRLTRQLLAEATVLAAAGAGAGVAVARGGVRALTVLQPGNVPRMDSVQVDWWVMAFAAAVALLTSVALGVATALRSSKPGIREVLTEGTRTMAGGRRSERVRQGLVIAQVALTMVLLVGAGLLARSFLSLMAVDPGFRAGGLLVLDLSWPFDRDPSVRAGRVSRQDELLARLGASPGVEAAGLVSVFPLGPGNVPNGRFLEMTRLDEIQSPDDLARLGDELKTRAGFAGYRIASAGYFRAMGIPLRRGRLFDDRDGPDAPHVALISESLAAAKWPDQDPVGRFVQFGNMDGDLRGFTIVGVVGDVREGSLEAPPGPLFYAHFRQRMTSRFAVVAASAASQSLAGTARTIVRAVDPTLPIQIRTIEETVDRVVAGRRFSLTLIATFGVAALILATLGIYGLVSYLVSERTREIGIRLALGADAQDVVRMVLGKGLTLSLLGIAVGLVAAAGLTRFLGGLLYGVTPTDPLAFAAVMTLTLTAVLAASYAPARRALAVQPVEALRSE